MQYWQVKPECDNYRYLSGKSSVVKTVIGGELITKTEQSRLNIPSVYLRQVTVKKTDVYFFFGTRRAIGGDENVVKGWC